jgi:hypothetical protein
MGYGQYSEHHKGRSNPLPKNTRHKQVFKTEEIPHLWAHKTQESARNSQGNLFFEGDTIYSYGHHFPIARHVTNGKESAILLTVREFSVATSQHKHAVRLAIPKNIPIFHVANIEDHGSGPKHAMNLEERIEVIEHIISKASRARLKAEWHLGEAAAIRAEIVEYCKFFSIKAPELPVIPTPDPEQLKAYRKAEAQRKAEVIARQIREQQDTIDAWRAGNPVRVGHLS